ncbi:MAG: hypothetical protein PHI68_01205 [Candidatus Cloacimonetes bacterium]|nr:hypothetical protein [Candidatus Cloacimonadota bacterium]
MKKKLLSDSSTGFQDFHIRNCLLSRTGSVQKASGIQCRMFSLAASSSMISFEQMLLKSPEMILLTGFRMDNLIFKPQKSLFLMVSYDEETGYWNCVCDALNMHVYSKNKEDLILEVHEHIVFIWEAYATTQEELSLDAQALRDMYIDCFEVIDAT